MGCPLLRLYVLPLFLISKMSKENPRNLIAVGLTLGTVGLACTRQDVPVVSAIDTTPKPSSTFTPTPETQNVLSETPWPTLSPTPTETPRNPYIIENLDLSREGKILLNFDLNGAPRTIDVDLRHYRYDMTPGEREELFDVTFRPGQRTAISVDEYFGNVLIYMHSAYWRDEPLEAEYLRNYIEGQEDPTVMDEEYFLQRLASIEGTRITLTQEGVTSEFEIVAGAKIPHEIKPLFDSGLENALEIITTYGLGNPGGFESFKENQGILVTFCGWGPEEAPHRYTYTQYVLGLAPVSH